MQWALTESLGSVRSVGRSRSELHQLWELESGGVWKVMLNIACLTEAQGEWMRQLPIPDPAVDFVADQVIGDWFPLTPVIHKVPHSVLSICLQIVAAEKGCNSRDPKLTKASQQWCGLDDGHAVPVHEQQLSRRMCNKVLAEH